MQYFPAPAKLNLFLHVTGRRADGYHLLQSVIRLIDAADEVGIDVRNDGVIRRVKPVADISEETDLCLRAARLLKQRTNSPMGADIDLIKHLPVGGGLGGGSSDAATVLWVLNALWKTGLAQAELQKLGAELGADVPFFLFGQSAFVEGIGERMTPIALPPAWYLVLVPPVQVATAGIFGAADLKRDTAAIAPGDYSEGFGGNDLESVTCARHPEVAQHLAWLSGLADARMTGSGACVFAAFAGEGAAASVKASLPGGMRGFVARGRDRHPLRDSAPNALS